MTSPPISGAVALLGNDISTDALYPARYMPLTDPADQARHAFGGMPEDEAERLRGATIVCAGWNMGCGSSREQAATAMRAAGVRLVIARSFSRLFLRNCINTGLPVIESPALALALSEGCALTVDLATGQALTPQGEVRFPALPAALLDIVQRGGLLGQLHHLGQQAATGTTALKQNPPSPLGEGGGTTDGASSHSVHFPKTMAEKILSHAAAMALRAGDYAIVRPDWCFTPDDAIGTIVDYLEQAGIAQPHDASRLGIFYDHYAPVGDIAVATIHRRGRRFAAQHGIEQFHDVGTGISHQLVMERRIARPAQLIFNADSHTTMMGAAAAFGTGLGASETAYVWATGSIWLRVPATIKIVLQGRLRPGASAKDACLTLLHRYGMRVATYRAVEFAGPGAQTLAMDERMTLCNMAVELGAKAAMFPFDETTAAYFGTQGIAVAPDIQARARPDAEAIYESVIDFDLTEVAAMVACPPTVDNVKPLKEVTGTRIDQAFLGSCTNGRLEDLSAASNVLRGRHVAPGVRMIVTPASASVYGEALKSGVIEILHAAGCIVTAPGCGACAGLHQGVLGDEEVCVASSNRNFTGRMGSATAQIYLASPQVVAASAVAGFLQDPGALPPL